MFEQRYDIFLSYFREDTGGWTGYLSSSLSHQLPSFRVFKDDEQTTAGTKWAPRLKRLVRDCRFFVLVISKQWATPKYQSLLADPNCWVRKEILIAKQHQRKIIPVLVNGASLPHGLPTEIQKVINDTQYFIFSAGTAKWDDEIASFCSKHILSEARLLNPDQTLTRLFAPLNRHQESPWVRSSVTDGHTALAVCANSNDEPRIFAQRCGQEINQDAYREQNFDAPLLLQWNAFAKNPDMKLRRNDLLNAIAKHNALSASPDVENELKSLFQHNQQTLVFYSLVSASGRLTEQRIGEWLAIWSELLCTCRTNSIVALLFIPKRTVFRRRPRLAQAATEKMEYLQCKGLARISSGDVKSFVDKLYDEGKLSRSQKQRIDSINKRLFWWSFGRCFKSVKDQLDPVLLMN